MVECWQERAADLLVIVTPTNANKGVIARYKPQTKSADIDKRTVVYNNKNILPGCIQNEKDEG